MQNKGEEDHPEKKSTKNLNIIAHDTPFQFRSNSISFKANSIDSQQYASDIIESRLQSKTLQHIISESTIVHNLVSTSNDLIIITFSKCFSSWLFDSCRSLF